MYRLIPILLVGATLAATSTASAQSAANPRFRADRKVTGAVQRPSMGVFDARATGWTYAPRYMSAYVTPATPATVAASSAPTAVASAGTTRSYQSFSFDPVPGPDAFPTTSAQPAQPVYAPVTTPSYYTGAPVYGCQPGGPSPRRAERTVHGWTHP